MREAPVVEEEGQRRDIGWPQRVRMRSVLDGRHRLTLDEGQPWGERYELAADPLEPVNRWADPGTAALRATLVERLARGMLALADERPHPPASA